MIHEGEGSSLELTQPLQFSWKRGETDREGREEHVGSMQRA